MGLLSRVFGKKDAAEESEGAAPALSADTEAATHATTSRPALNVPTVREMVDIERPVLLETQRALLRSCQRLFASLLPERKTPWVRSGLSAHGPACHTVHGRDLHAYCS